MNGVLLEGLTVGIEVNNKDQNVSYGYAKLGHVVNDKFINIENNQTYDIFDKSKTNQEVSILVTQLNIKNFFEVYLGFQGQCLSIDWIKYNLEKIYKDIKFYPPKKPIIKSKK